jgi:hypothetical protein
MNVIHVTGWNVGFDKIRMTKFLREEMSISLSESHEMVQNILDGKELVLSVIPERYQNAVDRLDIIGAKFYVE